MRVASTLGRAMLGAFAGVVASMAIVMFAGLFRREAPRPNLVPEDASGSLQRIAIHYVPAQDAQSMPVWRELFRALPSSVKVEVAVERAEDFVVFTTAMKASRISTERFEQVVAGQALTTWSRDRMASLSGPAGALSPPRVETISSRRAGDWAAPFAISRQVYGRGPRIADFVFEGGDLAASRSFVFADANLMGRNLGRGDATRAHLEDALGRTFGQQIVWLGSEPGDVPEHHIMMYMVPLDDHRVLVGDPRLGAALSPETVADPVDHAMQFDRVAGELAARGFEVTRIPVVVLPGAGSYVTYTNALFDRDAHGPVVYLPTYGIPALDEAAADTYERLGYRVETVDVSSIYRMNGSLGCLVNVMARSG